MQYRGYVPGPIDFDPEDGLFTGTVAGLRDVIHFHGRSADELMASFRAGIDDYLAFCAEEERFPVGALGVTQIASDFDTPDRAPSTAEIDRLRRDCAEAYQVVATLAVATGVFSTTAVEKVLDNLAAATAGEPRPHEDVLPFQLVSHQLVSKVTKFSELKARWMEDPEFRAACEAAAAKGAFGLVRRFAKRHSLGKAILERSGIGTPPRGDDRLDDQLEAGRGIADLPDDPDTDVNLAPETTGNAVGDPPGRHQLAGGHQRHGGNGQARLGRSTIKAGWKPSLAFLICSSRRGLRLTLTSRMGMVRLLKDTVEDANGETLSGPDRLFLSRHSLAHLR